MPSFCPKCHHVLEEDEVCCAQVRYTWRCQSCHKLTSGFALPYGKCFLCGGELEILLDRELGNPMRYSAIREAVQLELNSFQFYKLARDRATNPQVRQVLEQLYESELDHLHELEAKYHAHLDPAVIDLSADAEKLLADWLFRDVQLGDDTSITGLYQIAIDMEKRTRDHFRKLAQEADDLVEKELYQEFEAEEEEHIAMLESALDPR
jgi:rubrerythrin